MDIAEYRDLAPDLRAGLSRPASAARKLRVGLFADAAAQPRWVVEAFARIAASDFALIALIALVGPSPRTPWPAAAYGRLDRLAFGSDASDPLDLARHVRHSRLVNGLPERRSAELDVAFVLGDLDERLLEGFARFGVWRFCFGADAAQPARLAGFREVAEHEPVTASALSVRLAGDVPRLARQSWSRTFPYSVARNRAQFLPKTGELAYRALQEVHRCGGAWLEQCPAATEDGRAAVGNMALLGDLARIGGRVIRRAVSRALHVEQWSLAFRFGAQQGATPDLGGFTRIVAPHDRDWADPFPLAHRGRHYVFFEEKPYATGKGHISMLELEPHGRWSAPVRVLERDYHLSYPFLLEHEGTLYMIPESAENRSVELYRCVEFPLRWRLERRLLEGVCCVDATLHRDRNRWWMFANAAAGDSSTFDDELHLFHAEHLFGDWKPHVLNPVKSDPCLARPAGRLYTGEGGLYRPSQICVPRYGAGLSINLIERLSPHEYVERQVERLLPQAPLLGLHTLNSAGALTVVDFFTQRRRL